MTTTKTTTATATTPTAAITLVGYIKAVETREFESGNMVARTSLAVSQGKDKDPRWVKVEAWKGVGKILADTCGKGQRVALTGFLEDETFEGRDGETRTVQVLRVQWIDKIAKIAKK